MYFNNLNTVAQQMRRGMESDGGRMPANTSVVNAGDKVIASYYAANIVTITANTVTVDNGGYDTRSTFKFINKALTSIFGSRVSINTKKGKVTVSFDENTFPFDGNISFTVNEDGAKVID